MDNPVGIQSVVVSLVFAVSIFFGLFQAFASGKRTGKAASPPTVSVRRDSLDTELCAVAGARWDNAQQNLCKSINQEAAAINRVNGLRSREITALGFATSFSLAAASAFISAAAATATVFGIPAGAILAGIGAALAGTAGVWYGIALDLAGQVQSAAEDAAEKSSEVRLWENEVSADRAQINLHCKPEEANVFLNRPPRC